MELTIKVKTKRTRRKRSKQKVAALLILAHATAGYIGFEVATHAATITALTSR